MRIGRTIPPAAAPISWKTLFSGLRGLVRAEAELDRFGDELKTHFNHRSCHLLSSGKAALYVTLRALARLYPERDRVLIPAFTCYSVPSAIAKAGLGVSICDLAPGRLDFDFDRLPQLLDDPRLLCVIPTHLFGAAADLTGLRRLLQGRDLPIVEDAAQAMGATRKGQRRGARGDVCLFSLGRGKALSTVEGGILLTDRADLTAAIDQELTAVQGYSACQRARLVLMALATKILSVPSLFWLPKGLPFLRLGETHFEPEFPVQRMSGFQAGLARHWPEQLEGLRTQRRQNANCWARLVRAGSMRSPLDPNRLPDLIRFPILCADEQQRRTLLRQSEHQGLGLAPVYPDSVDGIPGLTVAGDGAPCPVARSVARRMVTLPVHPLLTERDRRRITRLFEYGVTAPAENRGLRVGRTG